MSDSNKENMLTALGFVTEALPNTLFKVEIKNLAKDETENEEILAYLSGKMRMHRIKVLVGDRVEVVLDPYGGKWRIIKRLLFCLYFFSE